MYFSLYFYENSFYTLFMTTLIAIAAISENRAIGKDRKIPWYIPEDWKHFKETTLGHTIVMWRKTLESIGRILPWRKTILFSKSFHFRRPPGSHILKWDNWEPINQDRELPSWYTDGITSWSMEHSSSIDSFIEDLSNSPQDNEKVFICWGSQIYREFFDRWLVDEVILSRIDMTVEWADAFFPDFESAFILERTDPREGFTIEYWKKKE